MFDLLFGWRNASNCKKLIKRVQCRLKILKSKRLAIAKQLREDIAQLLKNAHEQIVINKLEQLYEDENAISVYEFLDHYLEFIVLHLSYIRRHRDLPNDINEAVSTLIFASARCGDVPELCHLRKLFGERYGQRLTTRALEFQPGNLVSIQVKEMLSPLPASETAKNRLLDEIVRDFFNKPGPLPLKYKPEFHAQPQRVEQFSALEGHETDLDEVDISTNWSIVKHTFSPVNEMISKGQIVKSCFKTDAGKERPGSQESKEGGYTSESSTQYPEESVIYLDDVEEFKSPRKKGLQYIDHDQRFFVFKFPLICRKKRANGPKGKGSGYIDEKAERKRMRKIRSISMDRNTIDDALCQVYYSNKPHSQGKNSNESQNDEGRPYSHTKSTHRCSLDRPCYCNINDEQDFLEYNVSREDIEELRITSPISQTSRREFSGSPLIRKCLLPPPYTKSMTMPQISEIEVWSKDICRSNSLPVPNEFNEVRSLVSPPHVHPKLPDYDEIAAKFKELKKAHQQQNKCKYRTVHPV